MTTCRQVLLMLAPMALLAMPASAQQPPTHKGLEIIKAKCFQCHTDAMWRDQRQDARAWEANLYRMVGPRRAVDHRRDQADGGLSRHRFRPEYAAGAWHRRVTARP